MQSMLLLAKQGIGIILQAQQEAIES